MNKIDNVKLKSSLSFIKSDFCGTMDLENRELKLLKRLIMVSRIALALSLVLLSSQGIIAQESELRPCPKLRPLHVVNNLSDIGMMVEMPEEQLLALDTVIKKAKVTVNGTVIKDGQSTTIQVGGPVSMKVQLNGRAAQPFLKTTGITNLFFYFVQFEIAFDVILEDDQDELYTLFALVHKCDHWTQAAPSVTVSCRLPMTINVNISDFKLA